MKGKNKYLIILLSLAVLFVVVEYNAPKPIDWKTSFSAEDKIPYGSFILHDLLPDIFQEAEISINRHSYYTSLKDKDIQNTNLVIITKRFAPDEVDLDVLLNFVAKGNNAFIAANFFLAPFSDTLELYSTSKWDMDTGEDDSTSLNFVNKSLKTKFGYKFNKSVSRTFFEEFDTSKTTVLGVNSLEDINFIKFQFGKGTFYLHNNPFVFTNYNLLQKETYEYAFKCLSYLPNQDIIWDEYYKPGGGVVKGEPQTPLRFILTNPSLKSAYWIAIIGILIYMFFASKRLQRIIQIVKPPKNYSVEFAQTIGRLYFYKRNHKDLALKRFNYLLEFLRTRFYITKATEMSYSKIADKTGVERQIIIDLFEKKKYIDEVEQISKDDLMDFNNVIEMFYDEVI